MSSCWQSWENDIALGRLPTSLLGLGVAPDRAVVTVGEELQFVATGYYSDQETRDLTDVVEWQSWRPDVLTISSSMDREGLGESLVPGRSRVRAVYMGLVSNELQVAVTDARVEQLSVSPAEVELGEGQQLQLQAEAAFSDGSRGNISGSVRWITGDASIVTVGPAGRLSAAGTGRTEVRARYENNSEVVEASPVDVEVAAQGPTLGPADLRLTSVEAEVAETQVSWLVEVENRGERAATDLWIDAWLDRDSAPPPAPTAGDAWQILPFLAPGESRTVELQLTGVAPGTYSSWLLVDSLGTNFEGQSGETDNDFGPEPVTVHVADDPDIEAPVAPPPSEAHDSGADLVVGYFEGWADQQSDEVLYFIDVTNMGDDPSDSTELAVFTDLADPPTANAGLTAQTTVQVGSLAPTETEYLSAVVSGHPDTAWNSYALADSQDSIPELLEDNNYRLFQVSP